MTGRETIEGYLDDLYGYLSVEPRRARRILAEAEDHLREAVRELERGGQTPGQAEACAIERFGTPEDVARRFNGHDPEANLLAEGADPMAFLHPDPERAVLEIEGLRKVYRGGTVANDDITLTIEPGEVFGLLGPNGAGKTTLVSQVVGLVRPTAGSIRLGGVDMVANPQAARAFCSYLPQGDAPINSLRLREAIELVAQIRGASGARARQRRQQLLAELDIEEWQDKLGNAISGGVRRLGGFAMAAVEPGQLVILDEPTNDVDPLRRRLLWREVRRLADGGSSVILVTHNVMEAEQAVDRLAIIDGARVVASGTPSALKHDVRAVLRLVVSLDPLGSDPKEPPFAREVSRAGHRMFVTLAERDAPHALRWARDLVEQGIAEEFQLGATTLEEVYARLVGRQATLDGEGDGA